MAKARGAARMRFQENFAYAGVCPGFTEKLRMGLRAAALPNTNTSSIDIPLWDSNTSSIKRLTEHLFYEHLFDKKGALLLVHVFCSATQGSFRCPTRFGVAYLVAALSTIT